MFLLPLPAHYRYMDAGANGNPHSVVPSGRNQICWDPRGFNGTLRPGQAKVTQEQYQAILVAQMKELLGGSYVISPRTRMPTRLILPQPPSSLLIRTYGGPPPPPPPYTTNLPRLRGVL